MSNKTLTYESKNYRLKDKNKKLYIVYHGIVDDYDYSEFSSEEEAAKADWQDNWYEEDDGICFDENGEKLSLEEAKEAHRENFVEYTPAQVLEAAEEGLSWPIDLEFVVEK